MNDTYGGPQFDRPPPAPVANTTPIAVALSDVEARVLGSMVEKSFLTPDVYPMTTNAMVSACNQKTNRDPVVSYTAVEIDAALLDMRQRSLVRRVHTPGSRSTKHRQTLDEALVLNERQLVLVSVLLLRGPQTIGELRLRTERHDVGFDDLDAVESCLVGMSERSTPLVRQLPRQPGHKENRWQHLLSDPEAEDSAAAEPSASTDAPPTALAPSAPPTTARPAHPPAAAAPTPPAETVATAADVAAAAPPSLNMQDRIATLEDEVAQLRRQLNSLAESLGESLD